jgi:hypothetical protein
MGNRDRDDLGKFVRVSRPNRGLHLRVPLGTRFDHHRDLLRGFDFPAPVIE